MREIKLANVRPIVGLICVSVAWLYPYSAGGSPDAMQQIFMLASLVTAALLLGLGPLSASVAVAVAVGASTMLITPNPYWGTRVAGVAGLLLVALASQVGAQMRRKPSLLPLLLFALVTAAMINAAEGLLQWFGLVGEFYRWVVEPEQRGIAYGAFRQRNLFATFLCVGAVCVIWLVQLRRVSEAMAWFLLMVLMLGVAASGSRTGMLEAVALAILAVLWRKQQSAAVTRLMVGQLGLLAVSIWFLPIAAGWHGFEFTSGASRLAQGGQDARLTIWDNAIQMIGVHPWTGWGWREMGYGRYITLLNNRFDGLLEHAHNLPLQLAVEFGLPVALAVCGSLYWVVWRAKPWKVKLTDSGQNDASAADRSFAWAILLLIVGIHSMLEYPLWTAGFLFLTGLCVGYLLPEVSDSPSVTFWRTSHQRLPILFAIGLLALSLVAWQQYAKVRLIYKIPFTNNIEWQRAEMAAAIANASGAWLFQEQLDFSTLGLTAVTTQNASEVRARAEKLLHYAAAPQVIQPLLLSLWYHDDLAALRFHAERFCRAFPSVFKKWSDQPVVHPMVLAMKNLSDECRSQAF